MSLSVAGAGGGTPAAPSCPPVPLESPKPDAKPPQFGRAPDPYRDVLRYIDLCDRDQATPQTSASVMGSMAKRPGALLMPNVKLVSSGDAAADRATMLQLKAFFEQDPSLAHSVRAAARQAPVYVVVSSKAIDGPNNDKAVNFDAVNADGKRTGQVVALPGAAVRKAEYTPIDNEFYEVALRAELGTLFEEASHQSATAVLSELSALTKEGVIPSQPDQMKLYEFARSRYDAYMSSAYGEMYECTPERSTLAYRQAFAEALNERLNQIVDQSGYKVLNLGFGVTRDGAIEPMLMPRDSIGSGHTAP